MADLIATRVAMPAHMTRKIEPFANRRTSTLYARVAATQPRACKGAMARRLLMSVTMKQLSIADLSLVTGGARPTVQSCRADDFLAGKMAGYANTNPTELVSPGEWKRLSKNSTGAADDCWSQVLRRRR
jgi:hypothetical protein